MPVDTPAEALRGIDGVIISGGPRSVVDVGAPAIDSDVLSLGVPILGICYGHQLLAHMLQGTVVRHAAPEYGLASLTLSRSKLNSIFTSVDEVSPVWMSHGDSVERAPEGFSVLASTPDCPVAAMGDERRRIFGVQFHPEVSHSQYGQRILENFVQRVCEADGSWNPRSDETILAIKSDIRARVGPTRKVLFFVSGGVDSSVAYKLCADALGESRLRGVYVNTGFMRECESQAVMSAYAAAGFRNIEMVDASSTFLEAVTDDFDPESKRKHIGATFLAIENKVLAGYPRAEWLLGQGTIYPDTIESGGTTHAAHIKTHHNRVEELFERIASGDVIEPLVQFYKDEVRDIGRALGLPRQLVDKQPFPGPGLAVRYLCAKRPDTWKDPVGLADIAAAHGYRARALPLRAVGVQGDERTYAFVAVLEGRYDQVSAGDASRAITNQVADVNRVSFWVAGKGRLDDFSVCPMNISVSGLDLLRKADAIVRRHLEQADTTHRIWQCPVILLPLRKSGFCSVAIRPVESQDGMTAQYSRLSESVLRAVADEVLGLEGVDAVLYDVTNKPPATIEWE